MLAAACADPGDVPFEDEAGIRYWLGPGGEKLSEDSNSHSYNWVEYYSEDLQKTYYHNQVRQYSPTSYMHSSGLATQQQQQYQCSWQVCRVAAAAVAATL